MPRTSRSTPRHLARPPRRSAKLRRGAIALLAVAALPLAALTTSTPATAAGDSTSRTAGDAKNAALTAVSTGFGTTIWQGNGQSRKEAMDRQTSIYGPLDVVRVFYAGMPASWSSIQSDIGQTRAIVSFNPSPASVLSGSLDGQLLDWFRQAPRDHVTRWVYWHEPEDDIEAGSLDAGQYRAAWQHLDALADQANNPRLRATLVLMCWTMEKNSHRNWRDYYPGDSVIDVLGFDCYNAGYRSGRYRAPSELFGPARQAATEAGKRWGVAEMGSVVVSGDNGTGRANWLQDSASWLRANGARFASYFDSDVGVDYRLLDDASRNSWRQIVQSN